MGETGYLVSDEAQAALQEENGRLRAENGEQRERKAALAIQLADAVQRSSALERQIAPHQQRIAQVEAKQTPPPVEVVEHQGWRGWGSRGQRWGEAPRGRRGQGLGHSRLSVGIASLVAPRRTGRRLPVRVIRRELAERPGRRVRAAATSPPERRDPDQRRGGHRPARRPRGAGRPVRRAPGPPAGRWPVQDEGLLWVRHPAGHPDNHAARRADRPPGIARPIRGGTRSPRGSQTRRLAGATASLAATASASGLNPLPSSAASSTPPSLESEPNRFRVPLCLVASGGIMAAVLR